MKHTLFWVPVCTCWPQWPTRWWWLVTENTIHKPGNYSVWSFKNLQYRNKLHVISLLSVFIFTSWVSQRWPKLAYLPAHTHILLMLLLSVHFLPLASIKLMLFSDTLHYHKICKFSDLYIGTKKKNDCGKTVASRAFTSLYIVRDHLQLSFRLLQMNSLF